MLFRLVIFDALFLILRIALNKSHFFFFIEEYSSGLIRFVKKGHLVMISTVTCFFINEIYNECAQLACNHRVYAKAKLINSLKYVT